MYISATHLNSCQYPLINYVTVTLEKLIVVTAGSSNGYELLDSTEIFRNGKWEKGKYLCISQFQIVSTFINHFLCADIKLTLLTDP